MKRMHQNRSLNTILVLSLVLSLIFSSMSAQSSAILPLMHSIKITSPKLGQSVPMGDLTISGTSGDNATTDCQVFVDWNDLKPFQKAVATGPGGSNDYSTWKFTYTPAYHLISNGSNEPTSKLSCLDEEGYLAKWYSVNVTGSSNLTENVSQIGTNLGQENLTNNYQDMTFHSLKLSIPTDSEARTLIKTKIVTPSISDEQLRKILESFLKYSNLQKTQLTPDETRLLQVLSSVINQPFTPERKLQLELFVPLLATVYPEISALLGSYNLNNLSTAEKLGLSQLLLGLGAIYLAAQSAATVNSADTTVISKVVISHVGKIFSGSKPKGSGFKFVGFVVPPDPCKKYKAIAQCHPHFIPIPISSCFKGNSSKCAAIDKFRNIAFCDDRRFDCIGPHYVPPLPGRDGLYYYPLSWYPKPQNYCFMASGCFKGNLPDGDCTPNNGPDVCDEFGNCDKNKWDCNDFDECKDPSSYCFPNPQNDTGPPETNLTGPPEPISLAA